MTCGKVQAFTWSCSNENPGKENHSNSQLVCSILWYTWVIKTGDDDAKNWAILVEQHVGKADVNESDTIIRKVFPKAFEGIEGVFVVHPVRVSPHEQIKQYTF